MPPGATGYATLLLILLELAFCLIFIILFAMWTTGLRSILLRKCIGGGLGLSPSMRLEGAGPGEQGGTSGVNSTFLVHS